MCKPNPDNERSVEVRYGGGTKKGIDSEWRVAKQSRKRSAELQTNQKHAKKWKKTKQKNTTEVAENKSKYRETNTNKQKQKQGRDLAENH